MLKHIPQSAKRRVIQNPIVPPLAKIPSRPPMTIVELPAALSAIPGVAPLICRQTKTDTTATIYLKRTYVFNGEPPESFVKLGTIKHFAWHGKLVEDFLANANHPSISNPLPAGTGRDFNLATGLRMKLDSIDNILPETSDFDGLADILLVFIEDEICSITRAGLVEGGNYQLTVLRHRCGSILHDHKAGVDAWIVSREYLTTLQHPFFHRGNEATFKITIGQESPADITPFNITFAGIGWLNQNEK